MHCSRRIIIESFSKDKVRSLESECEYVCGEEEVEVGNVEATSLPMHMCVCSCMLSVNVHRSCVMEKYCRHGALISFGIKGEKKYIP